MTTLAQAELTKYHAALDGIGLILVDETDSPYRLRAPDLILERSDFSEQLDQNKLDSLYWGSNRSGHEGAGQRRLEMPGASSPFKYWDSRGVDITREGEFRLHYRLVQLYTDASMPDRPVLDVVGGSRVVVRISDAGGGNSRVRLWSNPDGTGAVNADMGTTQDVQDIANDSVLSYVALATAGVKTVNNIGTVAVFNGAVDSRALLYAKERLWQAGIKSGTQWRFGEFDSAGTYTERHTFPDGIEVKDMAELKGNIYVLAGAANVIGHTVIYKWDGTTMEEAARPDAFGRGITAEYLTPFSEAGLLVGAGDENTFAQVIFRAFPDAAGHLEVEEVTRTEENSDDYYLGFGSAFAHGRYAYFTYEPPGATVAGLALYDPITGGWAPDVSVDRPNPNTWGAVGGSGIHKGNKVIAIGSSGVWATQIGLAARYRTSGYLDSSIIDINVSADKLWLAIEATFARLPSTASIELYYSTDRGTTWTLAATANTLNQTRLRQLLSTPGSVIKSPTIQYRLYIYATNNQATTPIVYTAGIGGWPASKPGAEHTLIVRAYPDADNRIGVASSDRRAGYQLLTDLLTRRNSHDVLDYQPPWTLSSSDHLKVRVAGIETVGPWGFDGPRVGGFIQLVLKEVE